MPTDDLAAVLAGERAWAAPRIPPPFPYFGGKSRVAHLVWPLFGDTANYVEPFAGSLAVLLARPQWEGRTETVNELNPYIANWWRAVRDDPDAVAHYADWPVNEADLHARHRWLLKQADWRERMLSDPDYYDAQVAGWWVWGICAWIGHGWCDVGALREDGATVAKMRHLGDGGRGVNRVAPVTQMRHLSDRGQGIHSASRVAQVPHLGDAGQGINRRQLPHLGDAGRGVHRAQQAGEQLPHLGNDGRGVHRDRHSGNLQGYFTLLAERLRRVRVVCGDWSRVTGPSVTFKHGTTAVFLDPPYLTGGELYAVKRPVADAVLAWCKENWTNPELRIVLCGYEGDLDVPSDWRCIAWKQRAGYQSQDKGNAERERLWVSPACLDDAPRAGQQALFAEVPDA